MNIVQKYLPKLFWHGQQEMKLQVLHDTGNYLKGDKPISTINFWIRQNDGIGAHAIGDDEIIFETIPANQRAWHVGGIGNVNSWGAELTNVTTIEAFTKQINDMAKYFADIRIKYMNGVDVTKDNLKSHYECNISMNTGSVHSDVNSYFKHYIFTMDMFRDLVQKYLNNFKEVKRLCDKMFALGYISDLELWNQLLKGFKDFQKYQAEYLKILFSRMLKCENNVDAIIENMKQNQYITSYAYWRFVLDGEQSPNLDWLIILLKRILKI